MPKLPAIALVGDLHTNHAFGLMPPELTLDSGQKIQASPYQSWLWQCWLDYCTWLDNFKIEAILINGDLAQGINPSKDVQTLSINEADQVRCALAVLEPLLYSRHRRRAPVYVTRGTPFHDGKGGSRAEVVAREIGAVEQEGQHARYEWWIEWHQKLLYATHHTPHAQVYPLTPLYRQLNESKVRAAGGWLLPDVNIRSHVHKCHALQDNDGRWIATLPAWQLASEFGHKVAPGSLPDIGGLALTWDGAELNLKKKLYRLPLPPVVRVPLSLSSS